MPEASFTCRHRAQAILILLLFPGKTQEGKFLLEEICILKKTEFLKIKILLNELHPQFQMRLKHKKKPGILEKKREPMFLFLIFLYIVDNNWFFRP